MGVSFPTGNIKIDELLVKLSTLVKEYGKDSLEVEGFIEHHRDVSWVDKRTQEFCYFEESANALVMLMGGLKNEDNPDPTTSADYWKTGPNVPEIEFDDSADYWK